MSDSSKPPRPNLERLLQMGALAAQSGKRPAARALFHALTREYPNDERAWLGLAAVAATSTEQVAALQQALMINPAHHQAREALARLDPAAHALLAPPEPLLPPIDQLRVAVPPIPEPDPDLLPQALDDDEPQPATPFPLLNLLAMLLILLLLGGLGIFIGQQLLAQARPQLAATPVLALQPTALLATSEPGPQLPPTVTLPRPVATVPLATNVPTPGEPTPPTLDSPQPTVPPPSPTAATELPLGAIIDYDGWSATLLRPDYAVALDGAIGDLQPSGRFVLAVVAVINNSPVARTIPADLFTLSDDQRRTYRPVPGASSAYLAIYERGQRGDLALEDPLDPASGVRSVPILFDVAADATGLRLHMPGTGMAGWPISGGTLLPVGP